VLPLQHPFGQEAASQTHCPVALHACPLAQVAHVAPPVPQALVVSVVMHCPLALQHPLGQVFWSQTHFPCALHSSLAEHAWHVTPPMPQAPFDDVTHCPLPPQQPAQDVPPQVQAPAAQAWPDAHEPHASPWFPQVVALCADSATQALFLQQPPGHDVGSHVHAPATHS
jgi:hypothetical protein